MKKAKVVAYTPEPDDACSVFAVIGVIVVGTAGLALFCFLFWAAVNLCVETRVQAAETRADKGWQSAATEITELRRANDCMSAGGKIVAQYDVFGNTSYECEYPLKKNGKVTWK